jgi:hypothetical protein
MFKLFDPDTLKRAVAPLLTRKLFCGTAVSCAVGLGLGVWLEPPKVHYGSTATPVVLPQPRSDAWGDGAANAAPAPAAQPATDPDAEQTAAVSPPAADPVQLAQADPRQVAASGDTSQAPQDEAVPAQAAYQGPPPYPYRAQQREGDRGGYDVQGRDNDDYLDAGPPPGWDGPPPRRWGPSDDARGPGPAAYAPSGDDGQGG